MSGLLVREIRRSRAAVAVVVASVAVVAIVVTILASRSVVLALLLPAGLALAGLLLVHVRLALLALVATGPVEYGFQFANNTQLTVTKLAGGLCFTSFALFVLATNRRIRLDRSHFFLFVLVAVSFAASVAARSTSAAISTTTRYVSLVGLYVVITQFRGERRLLLQIAWTTAVSAAIAGVWGTYNFLSGTTELARLQYGQQNDFGFVLACSLPFALWLVSSTSGHRRAVSAVLVGCISVGVALSYSRGAWLALAGGLFWYAVTRPLKTKVVVGSGVVVAIAAFLFVQANIPQVKQGELAKAAVAQANVDSRLTLFAGATELTYSHPLLGIGPGNVAAYYYEITGRPPGTHKLAAIHNAYLEVAAELGVFGLAAFLCFLVVCLSRVRRADREDRGPPGFAALTHAAFVVVLIGLLTASQQFFEPLWVVGALGTNLLEEEPSGSST